MKNIDFENAITDLQTLFELLANKKILSSKEISLFNLAQKNIIAYYNFLNSFEGSIIFPWDDPKFKESWELWRAYKKQQFNFRYKSIAEQRALKRLHFLANGDVTLAIGLIDLAIDCGWMGFFPDKKQMQKAKSKTSQSYMENLANRLNQIS